MNRCQHPEKSHEWIAHFWSVENQQHNATAVEKIIFWYILFGKTLETSGAYLQPRHWLAPEAIELKEKDHSR
jgi:hypothetical protein